MTDRAPWPEYQWRVDDLETLATAMKADCNEHVNGRCYTLACFKRGGYQGFGPATDFTPTCHAKQALSLIEANRRLRADGATLRERVRKLPSPWTLKSMIGSPRNGSGAWHCDWCGETLVVPHHNRLEHPDNGCLWPDVHKLASAPKEPTP